jgi:hypothetical protein
MATSETSTGPTASIATITLASLSPYTQSRPHGIPKIQGEDPDDYDIRCWKDHLHVQEIDRTPRICIPAKSLHLAATSAASYTGEKIKGSGNKTWTAKFAAGIMFVNDPPLIGVGPDDARQITIYAHADGKRNCATRVYRRYPQIMSWRAKFELWILDPTITQAQVRTVFNNAGLFVGIGQGRPEKIGHNGRFQVSELEWEDNRRLAA